MPGGADIAAVAEVLADRSRSRLLVALDSGAALPASRLAAEAGVAPSTASAHLGRLVGAGLLTVEAHGRHRYYRLAGGDGAVGTGRAQRDRLSGPGRDVAYVLTQNGRAVLGELGIDCGPAGQRPFVRYCADWSEQRHHLAGALGARLLDRLDELHWIERRTATRAVTLTQAGVRGLDRALGLDVAERQAPSPRAGLVRAG